MTFHNNCVKAFYLTLQNLEKLEQSTNYVHQGNSVELTLSIWFLAIESFINTILRTICMLENKDLALLLF